MKDKSRKELTLNGSGGSKDELAKTELELVLDPTFIIDEARDKRLWRKLDGKILPTISVLFVLSFLDRANIGNAYAAGLTKDLHLTGLKPNIAAMVFYLTYSAFEIPANMLMKFIRPRIWISSTMFAWGAILTLFCVVKSYKGLLAARLALGLAEAGIFPGSLYYISLWYPRNEQAYRVGVFYAVAIFGLGFGGILAFAISHMDGVGGLHGWAWIFALEGLATVVVSSVAFFTIYDYPEDATFLSEDDKDYLIKRLFHDRAGLSTRFEMRFVLQALLDWKLYVLTVIYLGFLVSIYALALFLPLIITELGFTAAHAQLLTVPPYMIIVPLTISTSIISDRLKIRGPFVMLWAIVGVVGFAMLLSTSSPWVSCAGAALAQMGAVTPTPVILAWIGNNCAGDTKRAVGIAMALGGANLSGVLSSFTYRTPEAPRYRSGHAILISLLSISFILTGFMIVIYRKINERRDRLCQEQGIDQNKGIEFKDLGDSSPLFRYAI